MNDDPLHNILETSEYLLAYEATFGSMCAEDASAKMFARIASVIGPEATLRLSLAFGGKSVRIPSAKLFTKAASVTGAALSVLRKKLPLREASKQFGVEEVAIKRTIAILKDHEKFRKKVGKMYSTCEDTLTLEESLTQFEA
jgi:hypothetical protein